MRTNITGRAIKQIPQFPQLIQPKTHNSKLSNELFVTTVYEETMKLAILTLNEKMRTKNRNWESNKANFTVLTQCIQPKESHNSELSNKLD